MIYGKSTTGEVVAFEVKGEGDDEVLVMNIANEIGQPHWDQTLMFSFREASDLRTGLQHAFHGMKKIKEEIY